MLTYAIIQSDQPGGAGLGTPGEGRKDLTLVGGVVNLSDTEGANSGASYVHSLLEKPEGSSTTIINPTTSTPSFTPDVTGSYKIQTVVDGTYTTIIILAVSLPVTISRIPAFGELAGEYNEAGQTKGWHPDLTDFMRNVDAALGAGLDFAYSQAQFITVDDGAVVFSAIGADNNSVVEIVKNPSGSQAGHGLDITMGANATGNALDINYSGSGDAINVDAGRTYLGGEVVAPVKAAFGNGISGVGVNEAFTVYHDFGEMGAASPTGLFAEALGQETTASTAFYITGSMGVGTIKAGNNKTWTNTVGVRGMHAYVQVSGSAMVTGGAAYYVEDGSITNLVNHYGLYVEALTSGTNNYGIWIETPTGTIADAIHVVGGRSFFGGSIVQKGSISGELTHTVPATVTDYTIVWPAAQASGVQSLVNDGSGNLSWADRAIGGLTGMTEGAVPFGESGGGGLAQDVSTLFWDNATKELGVGTNAPSTTLHVSGRGIRLTQTEDSSGSPGAILQVEGSDSISAVVVAEYTLVDFQFGNAILFTSGGGTVANERVIRIDAPQFAAVTDAVTLTKASTVSIAGPPTAGNLVSIGTALSFEVLTGDSFFGGTLSVAPDTNITTTLGRALIHSVTDDAAYFSHFDQSGTTEFAIRQTFNGLTTLNSATGMSIQFQISGANQFLINTTSGFYAFDAAGPAMYNLAAAAGVVAFANDRSGPTSGFGGLKDVPAMVVGGNEVLITKASMVIANQPLGVGIAPLSVLHVKGSGPGTIGDSPAGQVNIQSPTDDVNTSVVITAYKSDGAGDPDVQLWYLGSSSSSDENITLLNRRNAALTLGTNNTTRLTISAAGAIDIGGTLTLGGLAIGQTVSASGLPPTALDIDFGAHDAITAGVEWNAIDIGWAGDPQWATGTLPTQAFTIFRGSTVDFVGPSTANIIATVYINGEPAEGVNATFDEAYALRLQGPQKIHDNTGTGDTSAKGLWLAAGSTTSINHTYSPMLTLSATTNRSGDAGGDEQQHGFAMQAIANSGVSPTTGALRWLRQKAGMPLLDSGWGSTIMTLDQTGDLTLTGDLTMADAKNVVINTTTGTKIGTGTNQKLGFWNAAPVIRPTALTTALTQITHTGPGSPDYAIAVPISSNAWGFSLQAEFETAMSVILNLQVRVDELETKMQAMGLLA